MPMGGSGRLKAAGFVCFRVNTLCFCVNTCCVVLRSSYRLNSKAYPIPLRAGREGDGTGGSFYQQLVKTIFALPRGIPLRPRLALPRARGRPVAGKSPPGGGRSLRSGRSYTRIGLVFLNYFNIPHSTTSEYIYTHRARRGTELKIVKQVHRWAYRLTSLGLQHWVCTSLGRSAPLPHPSYQD